MFLSPLLKPRQRKQTNPSSQSVCLNPPLPYNFPMNRRRFLGTLTAASTACSASSALAQSSQSKSTPDFSPATLVRTPLNLIAPRQDGIDAVWAVNELAKGRLEWQTETGSSGTVSSDPFGFVPQANDFLRIRLDRLSPGTKYRLRSITTSSDGSRQEISDWKSFRTLDPSSSKSEFVVWNDTHVNNETIQKLNEVTPPADFLFWNGDTCNDWKSPDLLIPTLLHPGERDITQNRPLLLAFGNHDVRGPHAYEMPRLIATPNHRPFYAFRSGPLAAIVLHTGEDKPDDHFSFQGRVAFDTLRREQAEWLADTIRQPEFRDAPYRLVFCHIPLRWQTEIIPDYSKGGFDHFSLRSRDAWHQSLVDWKTQLVISGHTHRDAFLPANEQFPYAQITGGGPAPQRATWMHAVASANEFILRVHNLEGAVRHEVTLKPIA
jgi:hypothetical protein